VDGARLEGSRVVEVQRPRTRAVIEPLTFHLAGPKITNDLALPQEANSQAASGTNARRGGLTGSAAAGL